MEGTHKTKQKFLSSFSLCKLVDFGFVSICMHKRSGGSLVEWNL